MGPESDLGRGLDALRRQLGLAVVSQHPESDRQEFPVIGLEGGRAS